MVSFLYIDVNVTNMNGIANFIMEGMTIANIKVALKYIVVPSLTNPIAQPRKEINSKIWEAVTATKLGLACEEMWAVGFIRGGTIIYLSATGPIQIKH